MSKAWFCIFTYRRLDLIQKTIRKWTHQVKDSGWDLKVICDSKESRIVKLMGYEVIELPEQDKGLCYAMNYVADLATQDGVELIFKCDDDVKSWGTRKCSKPDLNAALKDIKKAFEANPKLGGVGFGYSAFADGVNRWEREGNPLHCLSALRTQFVYTPIEIDALEDNYRKVVIHKAGYTTARYGKVGIGVMPTGTTPGGWQVGGSRLDRTARGKAAMQKMYPEIKFKPSSNGSLGAEVDYKASGMVMQRPTGWFMEENNRKD